MIRVVDALFARNVPEVAVVLSRAFAIATLLLAVDLLLGCATTGNRTAEAADQLERVADAFAERRNCDEADAACTDDSYLPAAGGFSDEAHDFRRTLGEGVSDRDVLLAYERLWRRYHTLRYDVSRLGDDRALQADWRPVAAAFADVQQHVKAWYSDSDPNLLSRGGYFLDPYYN